MRPFPFRAQSTLLGFTALALSLWGCEDNNSSVYIVDALAPDSECVFTFDAGSLRLSRGLMDKAATDRYVAGILVGNQLVPQGDDELLKTETNRISLRGAEVRLRTAAGGDIVSYTTNAAGTIDPNSGADPGFGGTTVVLIPPGLDLPPGEYVSAVKVFGETLGNQEVESNEFFYPIEVCDGCLVAFPEGVIDPSTGQCSAASGEDIELGICLPGQDGLTDCRLCLPNPACQTP